MTDQTHGAAVRLDRLVQRYRGSDRAAVDDVSLDIAPGEFMTFLGPSGSGKTTTLSMVAGFAAPTSGRILVDGQDISRLPAHKRNLGMVFQQYALFPHMTAAKNVAFPLHRRGVDKATGHARAMDALKLVHLDHLADRLPKQLSGGQQQRVAVARAIVYNPPVLLMDEPLGALDKKLREQLQIEIARIHRELGVTIIFVTHDQEEALALSDRIAVFNEGRIAQVGTAKELYESPATLFVARFLGDSNVFTGRVDPDGRTLTGDGWTLHTPPAHHIAASSHAAIVVRPERMRVLDHAGSGPTPGNVLDADVVDVVYLGTHRRVELRFRDGGSGAVREPAGKESAASRGDVVRVTWSPEHSVLVPEHR
ncbi:ABC transporter ATP-binding protein [Nonomuraea sp. NPDC049480]|uniref:ABC transporter ATP-binding protein n=1 Tax=Nonomuraea sp. NPDC049480 TaxID=3364353 RepID=UPI00379F8979